MHPRRASIRGLVGRFQVARAACGRAIAEAAAEPPPIHYRLASYQPIGFELLPEKFTIPSLQKLYESIYQKKFDDRNFRKKIIALNVLTKLEEKDKSTSKKGAFLYKFNRKKYEKLIKKGINFKL